MSTFTVITLGCPKNTVDSRDLIETLRREGFIYVEDFKRADLILINTCCFINDAKEESIEEILTVAKFKVDRKLIVFGCLSQRYGEELIKEIPEIDALFGVNDKEKIVNYLRDSLSERYSRDEHSEYTAEPKSYRYIKIAEGCSRRCSFCIIPEIRGRFRSKNPQEIVREAKEFVNSGIKELILVAQDITQYGKDLKNFRLVDLLRELCKIEGDFWIRLLYLYPSQIDQDLIEFIAEEPKIVKYLDIPFQHSEERILRLMGRSGTKKEYLKLIRRLREDIPGVTLRSTFIVGFPTETEDEFQRLLDFIEEVQFDRLGVFKYSREEGTKAFSLKGQIPESLKERRYEQIMSKQALISLEKNRALTGREFDALIDYLDGDIALGRLYCHAPEIDGFVIIENSTELREGEKVKVLISDAYEYDLKGVLIK